MSHTECRVCGSKNLKDFFDLGNQPLANSLLKSPDEPEEAYPLGLARCADCALIQLTYTVDPKVLFSKYVWVTGTSKGAQEFSKVFFDKLLRRAGEKGDGYVLEIASNDGTFLKPFIERGYNVLGIDPAQNIIDMAAKNRVPTRCAFWGSDEAKKLVEEKGPARILFARNVLPHVAETNDFVEGLRIALGDEGTLAIEAHYAKVILDGLHYDSIYHEHLCYFTLQTLEGILSRHGLFVFDVDMSPISGGSLIVYAKKSKVEETDTLKSYQEREDKERVNTMKRWEEFTKKSREHREKLLDILQKEKQKGKKVVGWGASARSSTMLNFAGITTELIAEIADMNPLKQGKYTAGTCILIQSPEEVLKKAPQSVIILAWNFAAEIKEILREKFGFRGRVIIPLENDPRVETI